MVNPSVGRIRRLPTSVPPRVLLVKGMVWSAVGWGPTSARPRPSSRTARAPGCGRWRVTAGGRVWGWAVRTGAEGAERGVLDEDPDDAGTPVGVTSRLVHRSFGRRSGLPGVGGMLIVQVVGAAGPGDASGPGRPGPSAEAARVWCWTGASAPVGAGRCWWRALRAGRCIAELAAGYQALAWASE